MLTCKDMTTQAHSLIDGELGLGQRIRVRFHLFICKHCSRYFNQLKLTLATLRDTDIMNQDIDEPSESDIDAIVNRIKASQ